MKSNSILLSFLLAATSATAAAAEPTDAVAGHTGKELLAKMQRDGHVTLALPMGTIVARHAEASSWSDGKAASVVRFAADTQVFLDDGSEVKFAEPSEFDASASRFVSAGSVTIFAGSTGHPLLQKAKLPGTREFTCAGGRIYEDGVNTGFSSVCTPSNTRLSCIGDTLRVTFDSPLCITP